MNKAEAEKLARQCLYHYRENTARLAQKLDKYRIARLNGSRTVQRYGERGGRSSVTYINAAPEWIEEIELLEQEIPCYRLKVKPIRRLLRDLEAAKSEMLVVYRLKYEQRLSWERAIVEAAGSYGIADKRFRTRHKQLVNATVAYLDLRIAMETGMEIGIENAKTA